MSCTSTLILGQTVQAQRSSEVVGRVGEHLTLLCLAGVQFQSVAWEGHPNTTITFSHLTATI